MAGSDGRRERLRGVGLSLAAVGSVLIVCWGGFAGFVVAIAQGLADPAPGAASDGGGVYWPPLLVGLAMVLLSGGSLVWFLVQRSRQRPRLGLVGPASVAVLYLLALLALRLA
ncbi:hypothetical protein [Kitasatospora sp. NPDC088134]|uniref:hypothetical protein n=1 Tax=Kitasatospora sp. NPDC088134 TaxID=3364071 RepID=UPI0038006FE9